MAEVLVKTHLIVTDVHEEYNINWCGKIINTKPKIKNGKPIFAVIGSRGRIELNTTDMQRVEKCAKLLTAPKGRQAITSDTAHIYIIEEMTPDAFASTFKTLLSYQNKNRDIEELINRLFVVIDVEQ